MFRMRDAMANFICPMVHIYTHSSVTGKMAGTSVIPDFLAHWHTSGKIMFSNMRAIYVLFNLRLKACNPSQVA